jgi:hypothetical protein
MTSKAVYTTRWSGSDPMTIKVKFLASYPLRPPPLTLRFRLLCRKEGILFRQVNGQISSSHSVNRVTCMEKEWLKQDTPFCCAWEWLYPSSSCHIACTPKVLICATERRNTKIEEGHVTPLWLFQWKTEGGGGLGWSQFKRQPEEHGLIYYFIGLNINACHSAKTMRGSTVFLGGLFI